MHYLQTQYAHTIRKKCIKSKDHKKNTGTTRRPGVSGVQSKVYILVPGLCDGAYLETVISFTVN